MQHAIFACANVLAVGFNLGVIIGGGKFDPLASAIIISLCSCLTGYELAKLKRAMTARTAGHQ
jgi:hypothetical protein